jgi:hypothetical protein
MKAAFELVAAYWDNFVSRRERDRKRLEVEYQYEMDHRFCRFAFVKASSVRSLLKNFSQRETLSTFRAAPSLSPRTAKYVGALIHHRHH